jgi:hypothetical protein
MLLVTWHAGLQQECVAGRGSGIVADGMCSANLILLTTRQCAILAELLLADKAVAVAQIASRLEITPRRVRYDLTAIKIWLGARGVRLLKRPHYGILVGASADTSPTPTMS